MMNQYLFNIFSRISSAHLDILLLIGLGLFGGTIGGRLFQKLKIPQVVGYIAVGILIGQSGFNIVNIETTQVLQPLSFFALGLIGFMIGGELKREVFKKYGRQFFIILFSEGMFAFVAVSLFIGILGQLILGNPSVSWALGILLGAMASATAPAATTDVLWEYRAKGPLTTTVFGIVALDDALALFLFALASIIAEKFMGAGGSGGIFQAIARPFYEISGAIFLGGVSGLVLAEIIKRYREREKILAFSLGTVLFVLGFSLTFKMDMLLAAMTLGAVIVNRVPRLSRETFSLVGAFSAPIYVLFFVLVGAKLNIRMINVSILLLAAIYLFARSFGKMFGANFGALASKAQPAVRKYLPYCLFSQAGVAIGLSIVAYHLFPGQIGNAIVVVITTSTFIVQLIGPPCVKFAVTKAQEIGLNITEEDILVKTRVEEAMDAKPAVIHEEAPLSEVLDAFRNNNNLYFPVINKSNDLIGVITVDSIRQAFSESSLGNLVLALDLTEPVIVTIVPGAYLIEAREVMESNGLDYLPVVFGKNKLAGFIERRMIINFLSRKIIEAEKKVSLLSQNNR